jgi:hypothetical protein
VTFSWQKKSSKKLEDRFKVGRKVKYQL